MNKTETSRGFYVEQARAEVIENLRNGYVTLEDLVDAIESGDALEYAQEYADGHEAAIYYTKQDDLWTSGVLADHEADADDIMGPLMVPCTATEYAQGWAASRPASDFVRRYIGTLVYLFLTDAYAEGLDRAVEQAKAEALTEVK